ncbi:DUF4011 domain-containing protein [Natrialba sp. INN-245]|uniref:DUF4011 domain-containing protein n=1 Tax=Natrialba sp. INN-245 TaxID=2690967 RepID=UPI00135A8370|nr:DUF4011 domain-containing protein [Natrialba sp. INN-245]
MQDEAVGEVCNECDSSSDTHNADEEADTKGTADDTGSNTSKNSVVTLDRSAERFWKGASTKDLDLSAADLEPSQTTEQSTDVDPLDRRIDSWKEQLLDLTKRNKLVDFSPTKTKSLPLYRADALAIAETLMAEKPLNIRKSAHSDHGGGPPDESEIQSNEIASTRSEESTARSLQNLRLNQKRAMEEKGVNALFIGFCTLRWFEVEHSDEPLRSPLFLLSVDLERETSNHSERHDYELSVADFELTLNPALRKKLEHERGLALPSDEAYSLEYLAASVKLVDDAISGFDRWRIDGEVLLGIFDFTKYTLYEDLEKNREAVKAHPLIKAINGDPSALRNPPESPRGDELDEAVPPEDIFQVLDADSSQQEAIEAAKRGIDFVLQGPPGTGKSQTIANIIAEKLAAGETVLFVSEKQAALDVVKNRLDDVGLGRFCLEAHGEKANKEAVLQSLASELRSDPIRYPSDRDDVTSNLASVRHELNQYGDLLFARPGDGETTVYDAMGRVAQHPDAPSISLDLETPLEYDDTDVDEMLDVLQRLSEYEYEVTNYSDHPWKSAAIESWRIDTAETVERDLEVAVTSIEGLRKAASTLADFLDVSVSTASEFEQAVELVRLLDDRQDVTLEGRFFEQSFYARKSRLKRFQEHETEIVDLRQKLAANYEQSFFAEDGNELYAELSEYGLFKIIQPSYRSLRGRLLEHTNKEYDPGYDDLLEDARTLMELETLEAERSEYNTIRTQLGFLYEGAETDWNLIWEIHEWINAFRALDDFDTDHIEKAITKGQFDEPRSPVLTKATEGIDALSTTRQKIEAIIDIDEFSIQGESLEQAPFTALKGRLVTLNDSIDELQRWIEFSQRLEEARESGPAVATYLEQFLGGKYDADTLPEGFEKAFFTEWLNAVYDHTDLGSFSATEIEGQLSRFRTLDKQQQEYAKVAIQHEVTKRYPQIELEHAKSSEQVFLRREMNKSQRHKPLRTLFRNAPSLISTLKPCLMMSPLSVAQYIEHGTIEFDAVIFDEASQIMPQDAVSSLIRANQTIIAGDTKQLPPTSFFNAGVDSADGVMEDLESILDEAASVLPEKRLLWHYRSNTNRLIDFSNQKYYDNRLKTFPENASDGAELGVDFEYVENGLYDRGGSSTNEPEARHVVDLIEAHVEERPSDSLGVVAFSQAQSQAIRDELERRRDSSPAIASFIDVDDALEGFFVKSLENVQGDERDRLIFTIGYGPDSEGRITMNFGPLNNSGGERRLNVAVTRARDQITVVSSIRHSDIDLTKSNNRGVEDFKHYLEYAEVGENALRKETSSTDIDHFDSGFEEAVCDALRARGYDVETQVQSAGYSIDLGLKHPDYSGKYVLGIECDGAAYHSSKTARDRDRTRQAVLEDLGWEIHRIWSPDWTANRDGQLDAIDEKVEKLSEFMDTPGRADGGIAESAHTEAIVPVVPVPMSNSEFGGYQDEITDYEEPDTVSSHWGEFDEASRQHICNDLTTVVERYGPIEKENAYRVVVAGWDVSRLGKNIRSRLERYCRREQHRNNLRLKNGFLWPTGTDTVYVRTNTDHANRKIDQIPPQEIAKAAYIILDEGGSMTRPDLVLETARLFGYSRTGKRIKEQIDSAISLLERSAAMRQTDNRVSAVVIDIDDVLTTHK